MSDGESERIGAWTARDTIAAMAWFTLALIARSVMVARVEGVLEHDQAIVGLMALDIAEGRRLPIFFDGQRYMGALEAYTAAVFVRLFGHSPASVAMAPTFYYAALVAGQFAAWRAWKGRACGHLAATFTLACSPMMAIWGVIPRGGYPEVLAWGLATMAIYRRVTRTDRPIGFLAQFGWGTLFTFGYFLNPLSLVVYLALAVDWTFGRHGLDIRNARLPGRRWPDRPWAGLAWAGMALGAAAIVAIGCHIDPATPGRPRFVFALDLVPGRLGQALGVAVVIATFAVAAWWTGLARRTISLLARHPGFAGGALLGLAPFFIYAAHARLGLAEFERSLPVWVRPPWSAGANVVDGLAAVGPLFGGQVRGGNDVAYLCLPLFRLPEVAWPGIASVLAMLTPAVAALILALVVTTAWRDRAAWQRFWALRGSSPSSPTVLALIGLGSCVGLYLIQASSLDGSSMRYLLPAWLFLPGLLGSAVLAWPKIARAGAMMLLLGVWTLGQASLVAEMGRPNLERRLADRLEARGTRGIVASGFLVQVVADLSRGHVGGVEYRSNWPRIGRRYADRFPSGAPITCVIDLDRLWSDATDEPGPSVRAFAADHPERARLVDTVEHYEVWRLDVPLDEFLGEPLSGNGASAIVSR